LLTLKEITTKDLIEILERKGISISNLTSSLINLKIISETEIDNFISEKEIQSFISKEIPASEILIPISIFNQNLAPLESIVRYLKEKYSYKNNEIAKVLGKDSSAISLAYKNSQDQNFSYVENTLKICLSEFETNQDLSILEIVSNYFKNKNLGVTDIGKLLDRDPKTIWTLCNRAKKKILERKKR
jgi:hypothetical protein